MYKVKVFVFFDKGQGEQELSGPPFDVVFTARDLEGLNDEIVAMIVSGDAYIRTVMKT
jgi:hypothetical protein